MPEKRQKLTNASLQEFLVRIKTDAKLKEEIVGKIKVDGVAKVVREFFVLSDVQDKNVGSMKSPLERQLSNGVVEAVTSGGTIRLLPPDTHFVEPQSSGISVGFHSGDVDFSLEIKCPQ